MSRALFFTLFALACAPGWPQGGREVRGSVIDARGGEALGNVQVMLLGTAHRSTSDAAGNFRFTAVPAGDYVLSVFTVGYHVLRQPFHLGETELKDFEVILTPDTLRQTDRVEVKSGPFDTARQDSPSSLTLAGTDAKNLASVLADDPLRAVQSLPGVSSNNDFEARFSLRGADFSRIGVYVDGVLLHAPFHMIKGQKLSASGTAFNGDMVEEMELHKGSYPARYGDRSAGILDVRMRDGAQTSSLARVEASASNAGVIAEGPLGRNRRGSWLVGARKSYLQYLLSRTFPDTTLIIGLEDAQGRLSYDLDRKNHLTLYVLEGYSDLDRSSSKSKLGLNALMTAGYHYTMANCGWQYIATSKAMIESHVAWMREKFGDANPNNTPLGQGFYGEWVWNTTATWTWSPRSSLDAGWSLRRIRDGGYAQHFTSGVLRIRQSWDGAGQIHGGYIQQSFATSGGQLRMTAGVRWDRHSISGVATVSPAVSATLGLSRSTYLTFGAGQYTQFPELSVLTSTLGNAQLLPVRSNQAIAALEQRFGERTRLRVEVYDRADRDLPYQPFFDPRILNGKVLAAPSNPLFFNSLRGYARGAELFVQRSSANRFTGWVSYAFGRTGMRDGISGARFISDWDQRHTVNCYLGYRLRPSVNMSTRFSWGSGFPIPGFLASADGSYYLTSSRNIQRLATYNRTDIRVNKAWTRDRWKVSLYGEVVNVMNRANYVFESLDSYNSKTGKASVTVDRMFPILPSAGVVLER